VTNSTPKTEIVRIDALAIEDAMAVSASPGSLLLELSDIDVLEVGNRHPVHARAKVLAAGPRHLVDRHTSASSARIIQRPHDVLIPGLVNAHSHLDLTHIGPRPFDAEAGFSGFVDLVRRERHTDDERIAESVRRGIESSLLNGVVAVADIAGSAGGQPRLAPFEELTRSALWGTSYLEFFAIGTREAEGLERIEEAVEEGVRRVRRPRMGLGISPHAPSTVSLKGYMKAAEMANRYNLRLMTHLAETPQEHEFIAQGSGPHRALLEQIGIWSDDLLRSVGKGLTPTEYLKDVLGYGKFIAVHCNDLSDRDIGILLDTRTSVAFCPRASAYFGVDETFGEHRYRELLFCGVRLGLGTDSIINLWQESAVGEVDARQGASPVYPISILDEMRLVYRRDALRAITVLGMATMDAAVVLGIDPIHFTFKRGADIAGVVAVNAQRPGVEHLDLAIDRILLGNARPELLVIGK
jgi:cytosine/adenosine deaminase-related metal-dependent hydrolase